MRDSQLEARGQRMSIVSPTVCGRTGSRNIRTMFAGERTAIAVDEISRDNLSILGVSEMR